jgi:hypothetical protein
VFIENPSRVLTAYLKAKGLKSAYCHPAYDCGRLAMALEIITQIKALESLPVVSDLGRQEAVTALYAVLTETGFEDEAYRWYEMLGEWRRPKFQGIPVVVDEHVPPGIVLLVGPPSEDQPASEESSPGGGPERGPAPLGKPPSLLEERRTSGPVVQGSSESVGDDAS